jgi:imidazolonepropionase-like amidohydrolase
MLAKDTSFVPTLTALYNIQSNGVEAGIPTFAVEKTVRSWPSHQRSVVMAREAGVRIAMGTDAGSCCNLHGRNLEELKHLVDAGHTPLDALRSATQIGAIVLGLENDLGTIEEGKLADMVVVEGNPLEDIEILLESEAISYVIKDGKLVKGAL